LLWLLVIQGVTGLLLRASYSPSTTDAWASVHYIEQTVGGSFIRGLHYWTSHALIVLFAAQMLRVMLAGAFRAPRELVWGTGVLLVPLLAVWAVTGNPLSATQKGFDQIEVEAGILGSTPMAGPALQRILVGGTEVGNLTLTRLYALHVAVLPLVAGLLLAVHFSQLYRHGLAQTDLGLRDASTARPYWPYQTIRNTIVLGVVLAVLAVLAWRRGAPLEAPARIEISQSPRPEWYFLFLFELRSYFSGPWEFFATAVIPSLVLLLLLAIPLIDRWLPERASSGVRYFVVIGGLAACGWLSWASVARDRADEAFLASRRETETLSTRARELARQQPIPPAGAAALLRGDPKTQGPVLFARHCATCHSHLDEQGQGIAAEKPSAANLYHFATRAWINGLLDAEKIAGPEYFGNTAFAESDMVYFVQDLYDGVEGEAEIAELKSQLDKVAAALAAEAGLLPEDTPNRTDLVAAGVELLGDQFSCTDCHRFHDQGDVGIAPDLTGYGSREWLIGIISDPTHERFYGDRNDRMPSFAPQPDQPDSNLLSPQEIGLIADWLRRHWPQ
jgi:ubiquinol-cytochrome c reductase cytochrome b subunit